MRCLEPITAVRAVAPGDAARLRRPPLRRAREGRWLGGVAAGIAEHLGLSATLVRLFLAISVFAAGFGLVVYILLWILTPFDEGGTVRSAPRRLRRPNGASSPASHSMMVGIAVLLAIGGSWFGDSRGWPLVLAAVGFAVPCPRSRDDMRRLDGPSCMGRIDGDAGDDAGVVPLLLNCMVLIAAGGGVFLAAKHVVPGARQHVRRRPRSPSPPSRGRRPAAGLSRFM